MHVKYKENGVREVVLKERQCLRVVHRTVRVTMVDQSSAGYVAMFDWIKCRVFSDDEGTYSTNRMHNAVQHSTVH